MSKLYTHPTLIDIYFLKMKKELLKYKVIQLIIAKITPIYNKLSLKLEFMYYTIEHNILVFLDDRLKPFINNLKDKFISFRDDKKDRFISFINNKKDRFISSINNYKNKLFNKSE